MLFATPFVPSLLDSALLRTLHTPLQSALSTEAPALESQGDSYLLTLSAPGVAASDLKISIDEGVLKIVGETKTHSHTHFTNWSTRLPQDADTDQATATSADGIVTVSFPKKPVEVKGEAKATAVTVHDSVQGEADDTAKYTLSIAAPGISATELAVAVENSVLKVTGRSTRSGAWLAKSFHLPRDADAAHTSASHVDGLLTITIPTKPKAEPRMLVVNEEESVQMF